MRSLFRSFFLRSQAAWAWIQQWTQTHKYPLGFAAVMGILLLAPHIAQADVTDQAVSAIIQLLSWIVEMLGKVFIFLVDIFLGFARYNGFGDAQPVKIGWVIVRDICNMFFIVVLLISAFSTIIGWDSSLRYNAVLPKLLLMAILINFSRTLVQVLIDFSQVVMLTFVNAFRAAGAGNFTAAFRINQLLSMRDDYVAGTSAQQPELAAQIFASFLLALILIVIANGVMLIMIAFVLGRIIGLWVALIFSPAAFFVTALPGKLQSGLSSFSGKYWSRLGGMLTGGPVVMFFIYLTFAILQTPSTAPTEAAPAAPATAGGAPAVLAGQGQGLSSQLELYTPTADINGAGATSFLTRVGTSDNVASFIVAVALMLMALEAAVEAANAVDSSVGAFANKVGSASKGLAFGAASLAAASPFIAAKFLGKGAANVVDKRYDITGKASGLGLRLANRIPLVGQYARKPLMAGMMMRQRQAEKEQSEQMALTNGMNPDQKRIVQKGGQSWVGGALGKAVDASIGTLSPGLGRDMAQGMRNRLGGAWYTQGDKRFFESLALDMAGPDVDAEQRRQLEDDLATSIGRDNRFKPVTDKGHTGKMADALADDQLLEERRENLTVANTQAERVDDQATINRIKKERKADPRLMPTEEKFASEMKKKVENPEKFKTMSEGAKNDVKVLVQALKEAKVVEFDADGVVRLTGDDAKKEAYLNALKNNDGTMYENTNQVLDFIENNDVKGSAGMELQKAQHARIEGDEFGHKRMWVNPSSKLSDKELVASVKDGLLMQSSREANAYRSLDTASKSAGGLAASATAGKDVADFLQAGGKVVDIQSIPGINLAIKQFTDDVAKRMESVLEFKDDQLNVKTADMKKFQDLVKELRPLVGQVGSRGLNQPFVENILNSMQAKITVENKTAGVAAGTKHDAPLSDIGAYKATYGAMTSTRDKKAIVELFATAVDLTHAPTLATPEKLRTGTRDQRAKIAGPVDRVFDVSTS
jgi:uncharacterized membrane protein